MKNTGGTNSNKTDINFALYVYLGKENTRKNKYRRKRKLNV